jgi:hypothetical protein
MGEAVAELGRRLSRLVLTQEQLQVLTNNLPLVAITGPPGSGTVAPQDNGHPGLGEKAKKLFFSTSFFFSVSVVFLFHLFLFLKVFYLLTLIVDAV